MYNVVVFSNGALQENVLVQGHEKARDVFLELCSQHMSNFDEYTYADKDKILEAEKAVFGTGYVAIIEAEPEKSEPVSIIVFQTSGKKEKIVENILCSSSASAEEKFRELCDKYLTQNIQDVCENEGLSREDLFMYALEDGYMEGSEKGKSFFIAINHPENRN